MYDCRNFPSYNLIYIVFIINNVEFLISLSLLVHVPLILLSMLVHTAVFGTHVGFHSTWVIKMGV